MNKVILLALIPLFTACTSVQKNTTNRVPNVWNDLTQAPVTLFSDNASQKLGESQPWKLTESDYYCINNKPDSTLSQDKFPIQGDGKIQKQWHQYFFDINSYFFRTFTCQSDYQILLKNILKSVRGPFYTPYPSQDQPNQYLVSDYKSFHQLDYHYALIDNLVSQNTTTVTAHKNNYQNSEEYTSNDLISQSFSTDYYNCRVTISAGGKYFDVFTHLCLTGSKSTYIFSDDDKKYVFYINFNNKNGTPNFQLKKHQIKLRSEAEISKRTEDNSPSEEADEVILNYHLNKTVTYNPSEIAIPINFSMVPLENGNFIIVTQIQDYNRSHFQITTLDKNFRVLSHDGIYSPKQNEFLELSNATSAGFTYSSSYNLLGQMTYYSYDFNLKTSEKIKESKRYSHKKRDEDIRSEFLLYTADDGRKFPMTVYYKSDYKKFQKTNFGLISSYGGFNQIDDLGQIEIFDRSCGVGSYP